MKCREGDIILDSSVLDPNNGTPLDPRTQHGWEKKVRLAHILFHEKMDEVMLADQLQRLESTPAWSSGWLLRKAARGRIHRAIPWILGAFVGSAIFIGSGQAPSLLGLF